jgi:hypothetical protein
MDDILQGLGSLADFVNVLFVNLDRLLQALLLFITLFDL